MPVSKLVRDLVPEIMRKEGENPTIRIADDAEYWAKLKEKLSEEVREFDKDENMEELADILEVIDAILVFKGFDGMELRRVRHEKAERKGMFDKRMIWDRET